MFSLLSSHYFPLHLFVAAVPCGPLTLQVVCNTVPGLYLTGRRYRYVLYYRGLYQGPASEFRFCFLKYYVQAYMASCLWQPIPSVLIVCIWALLLCNGKRISRSFCISLINHQIGAVCEICMLYCFICFASKFYTLFYFSNVCPNHRACSLTH